MTADDLTALNEQIAAMARAGLPLDQGLRSLAREMGSSRLRSVTTALARDLSDGHPLPEALARQKGRIPPYYANLVTAGIQSGRLPEVLMTLTTYARSIAATRASVLEALFYPAVVLALGLALFLVLSLLIVPQFDQIFKDFGLQLPGLTQMVMAFGRHPVEVAIAAASVLGSLVVLWVVGRTTHLGQTWMQLIYYVPLVGTLIRAARLAAFADLLGMLVEYGVPLPAAFRLAGAASSDPGMAARTARVEELLSQGSSLADAFRGRGLVPEWVAWLAAAGETRGGLAPALREIATIYRRQVETRAVVLRTVLPPLVVVATAGVLTGVFAVALMLPMIKLLEGLSK
ncbi:type II secretion system F family protein [Fimbriiglobus ruber]|uniref:General secretion pathway protein F n=1 Tax=Fimbriiglobus ruber TaxID=1908690 RepID=A0A225DZS5_9BACT|nr:type II secretion system F family protein [Fimbriiglobus ruber]OWK47000.1 General secretion pathway protein F [Fimbriiglobus ruber]